MLIKILCLELTNTCLLFFYAKVVARARSLVGENPFKDTQHSYTALKDALRLCAAFRGTYLDFKVHICLFFHIEILGFASKVNG